MGLSLRSGANNHCSYSFPVTHKYSWITKKQGRSPSKTGKKVTLSSKGGGGQPSQVPQLTWMSVGRTNALRAGNLTSEASSTEKMDCTPPHDTHHWLLHHVYKPWTLSQLAQVISGRSCSTFRCASSLSTFAPPVCPLLPHQYFCSCISQYFSSHLLSTAVHCLGSPF